MPNIEKGVPLSPHLFPVRGERGKVGVILFLTEGVCLLASGTVRALRREDGPAVFQRLGEPLCHPRCPDKAW
jgi:hypothetical protein